MWNVARETCLVGLLGMAASSCGTASHGTMPPESSAKALPDSSVEALPESPATGLADATVIELSSLRKDPAHYDWFQFKPGVKKLILSGTPDARHVSVLWYGYEGQPGTVPLHYHARTEAIFVIDGSQSDAKGAYGKGSFYFNPPNSAHDIFDSSGLFLLSYAAPPDFKRGADAGAYENVLVSPDYGKLPLAPCADGSLCYALPLAADGGMSSRFVKPQAASVALTANVLLVLQGSCVVAGQTLAAETLLVHKSTEPGSFQVAAGTPGCLLFELAFR